MLKYHYSAESYARYLTVWAFWIMILVLIYPPLSNYINVLFLSIFVFITAMIMSYISPGYFKYGVTKDFAIHLVGPAKWFIDITYHVLPLLIILCFFLSHYRKPQNQYGISLAITMLIMLLYITMFNPNNVYDVSDSTIVTSFILTCLLYHVFVT